MIPRREAGFALVSVLSIILILSLLAGGLVLLARSQAQSAIAGELRRKSIETADAAILRAILGLTDRRPEARWTYGRSPVRVETPAGVALVTITDELGRIDLNTADDRLLQSLFEAAGMQSEAASAMVDRVRDWSDENDLRRLNGAESGDYRAAGLRNQPRNGAFELVDELMLVKGMDRATFEKIAPALTVYSWRRNIDPRKAEDMVREALGVEDSLVTAESGKPIFESLGGRALRIRADPDGEPSDRVSREAIIRFTDNRRDPFWVQSWLDTRRIKVPAEQP